MLLCFERTDTVLLSKQRPPTCCQGKGCSENVHPWVFSFHLCTVAPHGEPCTCRDMTPGQATGCNKIQGTESRQNTLPALNLEVEFPHYIDLALASRSVSFCVTWFSHLLSPLADTRFYTFMINSLLGVVRLS